ncbi:MAG: SAM-dependent methyltransferase [Myxococcota bacterium]|jgi:SAM-dependent methyltransferase
MTPDATFLHAFHAAHPGATPTALAHWQIDDTGRSSYDLLTDFLVAEAADEVVVDLACGDGLLAEKIIAAEGGPLAVIGVDASPEELKKAKKRLRKRAVLHHGLADCLPIPSAEIAGVSCHMALMLMQPIEEVIAEIARILIPGGVLGAVVGAPTSVEPAMQTFIDLLNALPEDQRPPRPALGDPRTRSVEGLQALLAPHFSRVEITEHTLWTEGDAAALWGSLSLTYDAFALTEAGREALESAFHAALGEGPARCGHGALMVRAWK